MRAAGGRTFRHGAWLGGATLTLLALVLSACTPPTRVLEMARFNPPRPDMPPPAGAPVGLATPGGQTAYMVLIGSGQQRYACRAAPDGTYAWTLVGPDARLYNADQQLVGRHGAGPYWAMGNDSRVTAAVVAHAPSDNPYSVDQLLLKADTEHATGQFAGTTYIQRLRTAGGAPSATGCDAAHGGATEEMLYSASYVFYRPEAAR